MSEPLVIINSRLYVGGYRLSPLTSELALSRAGEAKEITNHESGRARVYKKGLVGSGLSVSGHYAAGDGQVCTPANAALEGTTQIVAVSQPQIVAGGVMYFGRLLINEYSRDDKVGEVAPFSLNAQGSDPLYRGHLVAEEEADAGGTSTAILIKAVGADETLYGCLQVSELGPGVATLVVKLQSATDEAFTSPNDRITFAGIAAGAGETVRDAKLPAGVAGPITDTYWRLSWTLSAGAAKFAVAMAIR